MVVTFGAFRLDDVEERLWKGPKLVAVRRKPFAILRYLAAHPKRLITHEELLKAVWAGAVVSESSVRTHLYDLRQVLGEGVIETVVGRGYRFIAELEVEAPSKREPAVAAASVRRLIVGREQPLAMLRAAFERSRAGHRQICFVTGEPGIGKTTLVEAFLEEVEGGDALCVRGQCIEQFGTPEAYLAVLQMIGQLRHVEHGDEAIATLVRYAPMLLVHVPSLLTEAQLADVQRRTASGNEGRLVRELAEGLEAICVTRPLVVLLEDVQWSDTGTLDLLSVLGHRRERANLLVIATSRRGEAQTVSHPLNRVLRGLVSRNEAAAIALDRIAETDIRALVDARYAGNRFPPGLTAAIERITAGTPLFVAALLDDLEARGMLAERDGAWMLTAPLDEIAAHRPDNLKQLIDLRLDRLTTLEQRVLEAASQVGLEFPTALIATALDAPVEQVDETCDDLARRGLFLRHGGTVDWPDGSQQSCYGLTHGLVQEVCGDRTPVARRQKWHRVIGQELERAYGDRAAEIATVLAKHFDRGQELAKAVRYYTLAAERMLERFAAADAQPTYARALQLLERLPETTERDVLELRIRSGIAGSALRNRFEGGEPIELFERAVDLARKLGDGYRVIAGMAALSVRYSTLARYADATRINLETAALLATHDATIDTPGMKATYALPMFWQGRLAEMLEQLGPLTMPDTAPVGDVGYSILDPASRNTVLVGYSGAASWLTGHPDRGMRELERGIAQGQRQKDAYALGNVVMHASRIRHLAGLPAGEVAAPAELLLANPDAGVWHVAASIVVECVRAPLSEAAIASVIARFRERTAVFPMGTTYFALLLIDMLIRSGQHAQARSLVEEMIVFATEHGEHVVEPELLRYRGDLAADPAAAAVAYREAIACATRIGAWSLALRAALSLRDPIALAGILPHFGDGAETRDVIAARAIISHSG